jgi:hypothetical protein
MWVAPNWGLRSAPLRTVVIGCWHATDALRAQSNGFIRLHSSALTRVVGLSTPRQRAARQLEEGRPQGSVSANGDGEGGRIAIQVPGDFSQGGDT